MKGVKIGGAMVSEKHANYFINTGNATSRDVLDLIERVRAAVLDATNMLLEAEVRIVR